MALFKPRKGVQRTVAEVITDCMREIKGQFSPGAKLTLVIRSDSLEQPMIVTNDEPRPVMAAIETYANKPSAVTVN